MTAVTTEAPKLRVRPEDREGPNATMDEAAAWIGISYSTLWRRVSEKLFTTVRDRAAKGSPILIPWDEVDVYKQGRADALRKFRVKKGRK